MNQNWHVFIQKLYKNEQMLSSWKFSISNSTLTLPGMYKKMDKLNNFITQIGKAKSEEEKGFFLFALDISNWEIIFSAQKQENVKILLRGVIICLHTVIWFQVFLSNTNNLPTSIWSIDRTLTGTTTSGPRSNGSEGVFHTPKSFTTEALTTSCTLLS